MNSLEKDWVPIGAPSRGLPGFGSFVDPTAVEEGFRFLKVLFFR